MFDNSEKEIAILSLRDRLTVTADQAEKDRITRMIMKLKRQRSTGFMNRSELADHYGVSTWKLIRDLKSNNHLLQELIASGWNSQKSGFYPKQVSIIEKHLG
jgi:hypothetical protein